MISPRNRFIINTQRTKKINRLNDRTQKKRNKIRKYKSSIRNNIKTRPCYGIPIQKKIKYENDFCVSNDQRRHTCTAHFKSPKWKKTEKKKKRLISVTNK